MHATEIISAIHSGQLDEHLEELNQAVCERHGARAQQLTGRFAAEQRVVFNGQGVRYLAGVGATVRRVNDKTISVDVDNVAQARGYAGAAGLRCDPNMLSVSDEALAITPATAEPVSDTFACRQTVVFNDRGRRYLCGVKATVTKVNGKSVIVDIEETPQARSYSGVRGVRVDKSLIELYSVQA